MPGAAFRRAAAGQLCALAAAKSPLRINGQGVTATGLRVLVHKDQVQFGDAVYHYTSDTPPVSGPYSGPAAKCVRCRAAIDGGSPAVQCACGAWFHHGEPSCFLYEKSPACPACHRPTSFDMSAYWHPEEES